MASDAYLSRDPSNGKSIYESLQRRKEANMAAGSVDPYKVPVSVLRESAPQTVPSIGGFNIDGGGAAASMLRRKTAQQTAGDNIAYVKEETLAPVGNVRKTPTGNTFIPENTIDVGNLVIELKNELVTLRNAGNYSGVIKCLFMLYCSGELSGAKINGLSNDDRSEILGIIAEFQSAVSSSIK